MRVLHDEILRLLSDRIEARVGAAELDVESVSNEFSDSIVESLDAVSYEIHDAIVADGLGWLSDYRSLNEGFVERNAERWGTAFDHLDLLIHAARECGELLNDRVRKEDREDATAAFDATTRLHARACVIAQEISCLLQAGFPDGAHARWRALHEVVVVAMFLADRGDEAVRRFYDYQVVEAYKGASKHKEYEHRLNEEPLTEGEILELKRQYDRVIKRYGKDFDSQKWTPNPGHRLKWNPPWVSGCHFRGNLLEVHRIRGASVQRRVTAPSVVELEVPGKSGA